MYLFDLHLRHEPMSYMTAQSSAPGGAGSRRRCRRRLWMAAAVSSGAVLKNVTVTVPLPGAPSAGWKDAPRQVTGCRHSAPSHPSGTVSVIVCVPEGGAPPPANAQLRPPPVLAPPLPSPGLRGLPAEFGAPPGARA